MTLDCHMSIKRSGKTEERSGKGPGFWSDQTDGNYVHGCACEGKDSGEFIALMCIWK